MPSNLSLLKVAVYPFVGFAALYTVILGLFTLPALQREALFVHRLRYPFFVDYNNPQRYGLAPYKTQNVYLNTSDGERIGAWHVLPRSTYLRNGVIPPTKPLSPSIFDAALSDKPTIIYFHGNAGMRATKHRVRSYSAFANTLDVNVLAVDYRGFGDSTGTPSEAGLSLDARAAWDYVASHASRTEKTSAEKEIILVGQSLGTGVVSALAGILAEEGIYPRALVLIAPFSSLHELLLDYTLFWVIPLLKPLKAIPALQARLLSTMEAKFDSASSLLVSDIPEASTTGRRSNQHARSPTLILCAKDDSIIPHFHFENLFDHLVREHNRTQGGVEVQKTDYPGWGRISRLDRADKEGGGFVWWEGLAGGHNNLGWAEGTIDLIGQVAAL